MPPAHWPAGPPRESGLPLSWKHHALSRLMVGTAQFGMPYGVANRSGQPRYADVLAIVAAAIEGGVNCFDTAAGYGTSEEVLGRALSELHVSDQVVVVTKLRPLTAEERADRVLAARAIARSVGDSRQRLRLDCLPVVLFHREADATHGDVLADLRTKGWLRWAGVSCDSRPGAAESFVAAGSVSALQLPASVVDRRHQQSGIFRKAAAHGVAVFIRSVYLQGLLLLPEDAIPPALRGITPVQQRLAAIASAAGMSLAELALRYILSQPGVTCALTGVETVAQVRENLAIVARGPLPAEVLSTIDMAVGDLPETLLTPALWPQNPPS